MADVLVGDIGSGVLLYTSDINAGTGNYDSFLRIQNTGEEQGFNTDTSSQQNNKDGIFTHSLAISNLQVVNVGGVDYYQIRLDLNETNSKTGPNITLQHLTIYSGEATDAASLSGLTSVFNLSTPQPLVDHNSGSGTDDYYFMIPTSLLTGATYLTLSADFLGADGGFEEFRALSSVFVPQPEINIVKETDGLDNQNPKILVGSTVTWTYDVTNPGNVPLSNVVVKDDNGTPLNTLDDFTATPVLSGGFNSGDINHNGLLDGNETWHFTATGTATAGTYVNVGSVSGDWSSGGSGGTVTANEPDGYTGVTASISIIKETDGQDNACLNLINGSPVTWDYYVTNDGTAAIAGNTVVVTDDNGTPGTGLAALDDFNPTAVLSGGFNVGDTNANGVLDPGETWQYTASGTVTNGDYTNTATVNATAHDDVNNTAPVTNSESDCYDGSNPSIDIVKETNGTDDLCPVLMVGDTVTWTYAVSNNSAFDISNLVVTDDNGTSGTGDDFHPAAVLSGGFNAGDINHDGILNPGETWQYSQTGIVTLGHYENVATVTGTATDENSYTAPVTNSESDCYLGLQGPCPRTPGFWSHWTDFWNGTASVPKQAGQPDFPAYDLLRIDSNHDGVINGSDSGYSMYGGQLGLLIGDYNRNGVQDSGEDIVFVSLSNALTLINSSTSKQMSDGVVKVGRDVVATWLNYLMGSPIGTVDSGDGHYSPKEAINDAINYLQTFGDASASNTYQPGELFDTYSPTHTAVKTSTNFWTGNIVGHSGADIHSALDGYNNTGTIDGWVYAPDCDNQQYLNDLHGYALNGSLFAA